MFADKVISSLSRGKLRLIYKLDMTGLAMEVDSTLFLVCGFKDEFDFPFHIWDVIRTH